MDIKFGGWYFGYMIIQDDKAYSMYFTTITDGKTYVATGSGNNNYIAHCIELTNDKKWLVLGSIDLTDEMQSIPYDKNNVHEILVSYGQKNSEQSYGGGTVVIVVDEIKPCYLPCYTHDGQIGIVYIYNHSGKVEVRSFSATKTLRVNIWFR